MTSTRALLSLGPVFALASFAFGSHSVSRGGDLYVNGVHILTLRTGGASSRAAALARSLQAAGSGTAVSVRSTRRTSTIRIGSATLSISKAEAAASGSTPSALASTWANNLRAALALPPVKVLASEQKVPLGGTREIRLVGSKAHVAIWRVLPPGFVELKRNEGGVTVKGRTLGSGTIVFSANGTDADAHVDVLPLAAAFPQNLSANVSGLPAHRDIVAGAIEAAVRTKLKTSDDVRLKIEIPTLQPLDAGRARTVDVFVKAEAPGAFPTSGVARVAVRNLGLGFAQEGELWYSNHPENVTAPGTLMTGALNSEKPVRLLYHHVNESPMGLYVQVEVANRSSETARLLVIPGDSEPRRNPVLAGIVAAERFLRRWLDASGEVVEVPPNSRVPIALRRLAPKETMSGLCCLWLLDGGPSNVDVRVHAQPPTTPEATLAGLVNDESPWRFVSPLSLRAAIANEPPFEHVYPDPFKAAELRYEVGGKHGFVRIGQNPIARLDQNGSLDGNFGVLYRIASFAENATAQPADLEVAFEASAGYSGALFVLNGEVIRTPLLQPKTSVRILKMRLSPGQSKRFDLMTLPLSGSSYPATLMLRPIGAGSQPAVDLSDRWSNKL